MGKSSGGVRLQTKSSKAYISGLKKQADSLNKKYSSFQNRYVGPSEYSKRLKLEVDIISNQLKIRKAEFPNSDHSYIEQALMRKKKDYQDWIKEYKTYK